MKTLILIRHGKSSWTTFSTDKERLLLNRGVVDIKNVAAAIISELPKEISIWSSNAKRALTTSVLFAEKIGFQVERIIFRDDLYTFDNIELENIIKTCDDAVKNLIIFGHNNAITDFVNKFGDFFIENVPTAGLVVIEFETDFWRNIIKGEIKKVILPKEIR